MFGVCYDRPSGRVLEIVSMQSNMFDRYNRENSNNDVGVSYVTEQNFADNIDIPDFVINKQNYLIDELGNVIKDKKN